MNDKGQRIGEPGKMTRDGREEKWREREKHTILRTFTTAKKGSHICMQLPVQLYVASQRSCSHHFLSFFYLLLPPYGPLLAISLEPLWRANGGQGLVFCMNEWALSVLASHHPSVRESCESMELLTQARAVMSVTVYSLPGVQPTDPASFLFPSSSLSLSYSTSLSITIVRMIVCVRLLHPVSNSLKCCCREALELVPAHSLVEKRQGPYKPFSEEIENGTQS
jgi:hypothetical protein